MSEILQGTTPSLEILVSTDDFLVTDITKLEFLIRYNMVTDTHGLSDVTIDAEANSIIYTFTEAETLAMVPGKQIKYQLRFMFSDHSIVGTPIMTLEVADLMSEDVMSE